MYMCDDWLLINVAQCTIFFFFEHWQYHVLRYRNATTEWCGYHDPAHTITDATIPPNSSTTDAISPENEDIMFSWLKEKIL